MCMCIYEKKPYMITQIRVANFYAKGRPSVVAITAAIAAANF